MGLETGVQRPLAGMAERRMADVMGQRQGLGQVFVEAQLPGHGAGDLRHFQRVGETGAVMIALMEHEDLGLVLEAPKRGRVDDPVAIPAKRAAGPARSLGKQPSAAAIGVAGIGCAGSSHSDRHGVFILDPIDS